MVRVKVKVVIRICRKINFIVKDKLMVKLRFSVGVLIEVMFKVNARVRDRVRVKARTPNTECF